MNGDQEAEVSSADATLLQRFFVAGAPLQPYICIETLKTERYTINQIFLVCQSVPHLPLREPILAGVSAGHWLILLGCPAPIGPTSVVRGVRVGHFGKKVKERGLTPIRRKKAKNYFAVTV